MLRRLLAIALCLLPLPALAQIGIMGAASQQCLLQSVNLSNNVVPSGVAIGTPIGTISVSTNATASGTTWDPAYSATNPNSNLTYSTDLQTVTGAGITGFSSTRSNTTQLLQKNYFRTTFNGLTNNMLIGVALGSAVPTLPAGSTGSLGYNPSNGTVGLNNIGVIATIGTAVSGDNIDTAIDAINGKAWFRVVHGGVAGGWNNDVVANQNPSTNTGGLNVAAITGNALFIFYTSGFDVQHSAILIPAPNLAADPTLNHFSPWQPFNQISCNPTTISIDDPTDFSIDSSTPPTTLRVNAVLSAATYPLNITGSITGAQNSPLTLTAPILATGGGVEVAGPSVDVYNAPFYTCLTTHYVATTGSDSNPGTSGSPWLTLQHANDVGRTGGDCIYVAAGLYNQPPLQINQGGNAPTPTGYVVYRCQTLDGCHLLATTIGTGLVRISSANFVVWDGFELDGNDALVANGGANVCIGSSNADEGLGNASHHLWVLNNILHHCNLAGVDFNNREWYYAYHNEVYHNAWESGFQGSGIGYVVAQCIEAGVPQCSASGSYTGGTGTYVPSGMDLTFSPPYHVITAFNNVHDNKIAPDNPVACGAHSDGNGIIIDTWLDEATLSITFPFQSLVWGNLTWANGGRGIHVFASSNVTIANNTAFGNGTDTCLASFRLGDLSQAGGANNVWYNNVTYSVLTPCCNLNCPTSNRQFCGGQNVPLAAGDGRGVVDVNNSYQHNTLFGGLTNGQPALFGNDINYFSCLSNQCATDPVFVNGPSNNFALQSGSPDISYGVPVPNSLFSILSNSNSGQFVDSGACYHTLGTCP